MAKAGMTGHPPDVKVAPAPTGKRPAEFYINDIRSTIDRLNSQLAKAAKIGVAVQFSVTHDDGVQQISFVTAGRA